jgi:hypothetical protein
MAMPTKAEVAAQMQVQGEPSSGQDTYLPARQLAAWQKAGSIPTLPAEQDQTQLLRMYMALKTIMGTKGNNRLSAAQFSGYVRTISHSTSFKRKLWVVPKANFEKLDMSTISKYIIDKATVQEFPSFINPMDIELVDQCISQSILGIGVQDRGLSSAGCGWGRPPRRLTAEVGEISKHKTKTTTTQQTQSHGCC